MHLADGDTRAVLAAATRLAADPVPEFREVLELLCALIPSASASFNDMALATGDFRYSIVPAGDEAKLASLKPAYDRYFHQHPLIAHALEDPVSGALRFCDVPAGEAVTETELYQHFYEPFGVRYQLVLELASPPDVVVGYALNRGPGDGEFSDRDVSVMNALGAHLALHHRLSMDHERSRAMADEAGRDGWAVVTVRSDGVVEASTAGPLAPGSDLPPTVADLLPTEGNVTSHPTTHDVVVGADRWRCVVRPVPVGPTVLAMRRLGNEVAGASALLDAGLTRRQAEVAVALGRTGGTNAQLARALSMSEGTVKKHLEAVYRVLGVDSRAAAVVALKHQVEEGASGSTNRPSSGQVEP